MKQYLCIDLKSFYASVECVERGLDPFKINLVVADASRGQGAITLAATPAIKKYGVKSRGRLFEIPKNIEYIAVRPRMKLYMEYATRIFQILLRYVASEDIHVYSIDESFIDITPYLNLYHQNAQDIAQTIMQDIYNTTGITATAGIGTNLFLAKVALDIISKHSPNRIGYLDEDLFRQLLWHHQPLTDFWMIGQGTMHRLQQLGIVDLYGVAHTNPERLFQVFGVTAQFLYDHAWGKEPITISEIKAYRPKHASMNSSQILFSDYSFEDAYLVLKEMVDQCIMKLNGADQQTQHIALTIGYSKNALPPVHVSRKLSQATNHYKPILLEFSHLYNTHVNPHYPIRQISVSFGHLTTMQYEQLSLFQNTIQDDREQKVQKALIQIKEKYGKNAVLHGFDLLDKATTKIRNELIGGHHA